MRKLSFLLFIASLLSSVAIAADIQVPADVSCRTEIGYPDTNRTDSSKLSIRSDGSAAKSWIKFDLSDVDLSDVRGAKLRLALHQDKSGDQNFDVSAVNDDVTDNIGWGEQDITWGNAPANDTESWTSLLDGQATDVATIAFTDGVAGQQFEVDVQSILQADTDGIVQFVLHNSSGLINVATHDHPNGEAYWPTLIITLPPAGADYPSPPNMGVTDNMLAELSWTNPDPNDGVSPITCDVYLGTDPNRLNMEKATLDPGDNSVPVNTDYFSTYGNLVNNTWYYWVVDCDDPSGGMIPGEMWSFYVGQAPAVDAGPDQTLWLDPNAIVILDGTTSDDNPYTVLWTQVANDAPEVDITNDTSDDASVIITERGDYEFMLTADDGTLTNSDTVRIVVGDDACDASHIDTKDPYNPADINEDCIVDLQDFIDLIAADWLNCTDSLTNCN